MKSIKLKNGEVKYFEQNYEFADFIRETMGNDSKLYFLSIVKRLNEIEKELDEILESL